jgi:putative ABC transport system permease protein
MNIIIIALRNLLRHKRRTALTASLIALGVLIVILFGGIGNSFKKEVVGILTNSSMGDLQIHRMGYVSSIDNLPLNMYIPEQALVKVEGLLNENPDVAAYSERIRFGGMLSNFSQTTNMRFTAVIPEKEIATCPGLPSRIKEGSPDASFFLKPGQIVIPENIATAMQLKVGSDVVLIATNKDGSVNGLNLTIAGVSENLQGPGGKDGYIHIEDATTLLRMEGREISEIAVKLKDFNRLDTVAASLSETLSQMKNQKSGKPILELHTWEQLSPFSSIAKLISILLITVRIVLMFIVIVSVMNVMIMSVYERIGEIGTIAAIGTIPSKILALFLTEGVILGVASALLGVLVSVGTLLVMSVIKLPIAFGRMELQIAPQIPTFEVLLALVSVLVISILASLEPAIKAARMEPVDALRHV